MRQLVDSKKENQTHNRSNKMVNNVNEVLYGDRHGENITIGDTDYITEQLFTSYVKVEGIERDDDFNNYYDKIDEEKMVEMVMEELINTIDFCGSSGDDSLDVLRDYVGFVVYDLVREVK
jgi:hypothetical protein